MSLIVTATITAKPGSETTVGDALRSLVAPTRAEEGCVSYELYRSAADPTVFVTIEEWREQADLDAHLQTAHVGAAFAAAGEHLVTEPVILPLEHIEV